MVSAVEWQTHKGYSVYTKPLEKPANDNRDYCLLKLANELQVLLISDPEADRASAALDVHVGSLSDPENLQGLAHFCEHLLFMGTKKYPKENDYYSYLSEHSGHANAYTATVNTNYFFEVGYQWLEGALDRFSHFFIDPLFSESCTERELRAVDSEHKKNLQSDCWRIAQVEKTLSDPKHPWHLFETGNLETLMDRPKQLGLDIRQELLKFHDTYYSANIMKLVVVGRESLDQLTEWVVEMFSSVQNKNISVPSFQGHPLTKNELSKQLFVKSVKKNRTLEITFPFPEQTSFYESQPANYLAHLTGHEGPGSILSYLKKKAWATSLSSGVSYGGIGFAFFHFSVELTEQGLSHYEDIVVSFFEYIQLVHSKGVQQWIFDEIKSLAEIEFRFLEQCTPSQYTSFLSQQMQESYPPQWVISGSSLLRKYDPVLIENHLKLLRPDNFRLTLACQEFPHGIQCTQVERWYSTEYEVLPLRKELVQRLDAISLNEEFSLPAVNEFIPTQLDVVKQEEKRKEPILVQDTAAAKIWYKKDDTFGIPKTNIWICFKNPLTYATPRHAVMMALYTALLSDSLTEFSYNAEVAGLNYYLTQEPEGIILFVGGFSHKLSLLLEKVVSRMKDLKLKQDRFDMIKDEVTRDYENFFLEAPFQHATYYLSYALSNRKWTCDDLMSQLKEVELEDLKAFIPLVLSTLQTEALVHGSMEQETAISMLDHVQTILAPRPLTPSQLVGARTAILPEGQHFVHALPVHDSGEVNSSIAYYSQVCSMREIEKRCQLSLMAQIAQEPCFNQLRTQEQLGYIVFSGLKGQHDLLGFRVVIQSERDPVYLENRVLDFLESLKKTIEDMGEAEYESQLNSLIAEKQEKFKNLFEEGYKYWSHIMSGYYEFNDVETDVAALKKMTKASLIDFYNACISPASSRTFSVHLKSQKVPILQKPSLTMENIYPILKFLGCVGDTTQDTFQEWVVADVGETAQFTSELQFIEFLKSKDIKVDGILEKVYQGHSSLSRRDHTQLPKNYRVVSNLVDFRRRMPLSAAAVPVNSNHS
ncbi:Insulinase (Peptidase M16) [Rhizopus stolonifer]|uniref:Insulinase (Peptidase M16) n=1 Tax=Rhizopus stolonifer TaxID=4846 RepID=A0A367KWU6_RHIST|nr:Insulinase (Peptidase M16) [Rhizopus stolonifer]